MKKKKNKPEILYPWLLPKRSILERLGFFIVRLTIFRVSNRIQIKENDDRIGFRDRKNVVNLQKKFNPIIKPYVTKEVHYYLRRLRALPDLKHAIYEDHPELSDKAQNLLNDIKLHFDKEPLAALVVVVRLLSDRRVVYYHNELLLDPLLVQIHFFINYKYDRDLFQFLLICWKNWPLTATKYDDKTVFSQVISNQLIQLAKINPEESLIIFDQYFTFRVNGLIWLAESDAYYYLEFANLIKIQRPALYEEALLNYIRERSYNFSDQLQSIIDADAELFSILQDQTLQYEKNTEKICDYLFKYSCNQRENLSDKLVIIQSNIELAKTDFDEKSLSNILILLLEIPDESIFKEALLERLYQWLKLHCYVSINDMEKFQEYASHFIEIYISASKDASLIEDSHNIIEINNGYWRILEELENYNILGYMYFLAITMARDSVKSQAVDELAIQAEQKFMDRFAGFADVYPDYAVEIFVFAVRQSRYSNYSDNLSPVLDRVFDRFVTFDESLALQALRKAYDFYKVDRATSRMWKPKNLKYPGFTPDYYV